MPVSAALLPMAGQMAQGVGNTASGLLSGIVGLFQRRKANQLLKQNPYPSYNIPNEVMQNQQMAQNMSLQGLPSAQYQAAQKDIQRQQMNALNAAQDRRGGLDAISTIQQGSNDATTNLNVADAQQRTQNQRNLMAVNENVAGYRDKAWDWNTRNKYQQNYSYAMGLLGAGNQNLIGGFDRLFSGIGGMAMGANGGGGRGGSNIQGGAPPSYMYTPQLANTGGSVSGPASQIGYINPYTAPLIGG